jgi:glycosyltransferase involved in cell wall biosynthesis
MYDLIEQGKNGMIVDRFDKEAYARAMLEIIKKQEKLKEYGENAKKRNERFSQESIYKKWEEILANKEV